MPLPIKVLIVDDHPLVLRELRALLTGQQWEILEAQNGKAALERIHQVNPDVVLLDIFMPEMSGLEVASEIRRLLPMPKVILMSSGYTSHEAAVIARLYADGHFVPKDDIGSELIPAISCLLGEQAPQKPASFS